jgi:hypothetical protein
VRILRVRPGCALAHRSRQRLHGVVRAWAYKVIYRVHVYLAKGNERITGVCHQILVSIVNLLPPSRS